MVMFGSLKPFVTIVNPAHISQWRKARKTLKLEDYKSDK